MRILVVGGGSGGHVTPVAAVCKQLVRLQPDAELEFWCDKAFGAQARQTMNEVGVLRVRTISAGKLRRYHGLSVWKHVSQVRTILLPNIVDSFKLIVGFGQSLWFLSRNRPDVVFAKGGFVCLPVGLAARVLRVPLVIHDSDAHPGLTNRVLSRYATAIGTGAPLSYYPMYPASITKYVGIPVAPEFKAVSAAQRTSAKKKIGFDEHEPLVVITGGGLGAVSVNTAVVAVIDDLTRLSNVLLVAGANNETDVLSKLDAIKRLKNKVRVVGYLAGHDMRQALEAADVVVTRAGATTLLELAALHKPTVIVPNDLLTGGHQTKNANVYKQADAAVIVTETELEASPRVLVDTLTATLCNPTLMKRLQKAIGSFAKPDAARDMAVMILDSARPRT